jgi:glycosyltransferase involved in cell wall biosynthesis
MLAICAIFKNEETYLYEWLSFHRYIGVERFFLYNNNSSDKSLDVIAGWPDRKCVTVIEWPMVFGQEPAYKHMIENYRGEADWCAFIDCDEFICPQSDVNVTDVLRSFENRCSGLYVHWLMFGSSGEREHRPGLVTERFTTRAESNFEPNRIGKSIVRLKDARRGGVHIVSSSGAMLNDSGDAIDQTGGGIHTSSSHRLLAINHYYTKSLEEWRIRRAAGRADRPPSASDFRRTEAEFWLHDQNVVTDLKALKITQLMKPHFYPGPDPSGKLCW